MATISQNVNDFSCFEKIRTINLKSVNSLPCLFIKYVCVKVEKLGSKNRSGPLQFFEKKGGLK